jgi:putative ABC transport system permease protein
MVNDLRYAFRQLTKNPGFTAVAVLTLALGIGANTAIFSLVDAILLRPLSGVEEPERLVAVYTSDYSSTRYGTSSYPDYVDYRDRNEVFSGLAAYFDTSINLSAGSAAERTQGAVVSGNYFLVLGVKTTLGRPLLPEDDKHLGAHPVAVVSYEAWQRRFGADPGLVGKTVLLNNHTFTLVGVIAEGFRGTSLRSVPEVWVPMSTLSQLEPSMPPQILHLRGARWLSVVGHLKPDVKIEQAQAGTDTIAAQLAQAFPETNRGTLQQPDRPRPMSLIPANVALVGPAVRDSAQRVSQLLAVAVGFVLLIACANVANLLLVRAHRRQKEIAVRFALGAKRSRIVRQMLTESLLLFLVGGGLGLLLGVWLSDLLLSTNLFAALVGLRLSLDIRVLGFTLLISVLTGLVFGLVPALQASRSDLIPALKAFELTSGSLLRRYGVRNLLVVFQVALSLVLLIGAGLFLRSLQKAYATDLGFSADKALLVSVDLERQGYDEARARAFYEQIRERVATLPGVRAASLADCIPVDPRGSRTNVTIEGYTPWTGEDMELNFNVVDHHFLEAMGISLLRGRNFTEQDGTSPARVIMVNEALARKYWPGQDPVGRRVRLGRAEESSLEIVGVVKTGKYRNLREEPMPYIYFPFGQNRLRRTLLVRTVGHPEALLAAVRAEVQHLDKNLPLFDIKTLDEHLGRALAQERTNAQLVGLFSLLALLLAAVGVYGVMTYAVTQRTHEIGVRMALGAHSHDVMRLVVGYGMRLSILGLVIGLVGALSLTRFISSLLYQVKASDPATFIAVALLLGAVALLACWLPARRAARVDPVVALRCE